MHQGNHLSGSYGHLYTSSTVREVVTGNEHDCILILLLIMWLLRKQGLLSFHFSVLIHISCCARTTFVGLRNFLTFVSGEHRTICINDWPLSSIGAGFDYHELIPSLSSLLSMTCNSPVVKPADYNICFM